MGRRGGSIKADKGQCAECGVRGGSREPGQSMLFAFSICPNSSWWAGREREVTWCSLQIYRHRLLKAYRGWWRIQSSEKYIFKNEINITFIFFFSLNHNFLPAFSLHGKVTLFLKDACSQPTLDTGARNLRNLFSKLLILQNNQPPPSKAVPEPLLNNDGIVHLEKKTGVGCCIYQFSLSLFRPLLVCRGMAKAHFGPSRLSCAHGIT